jgi:hypothetical protein
MAGGAVAIGLACLAVLVVVAKGGDLWAGYALAQSGEALAEAASKGAGVDRDRALARAQANAQNGLAVTPEDPRLWDALAETRLQQAVAGGAGRVSPTLLTASAEASARAATLAPREGAVQARLAYVRSLQQNAPAAAAALKQSYDLTSTSATFGHRRVETAGRAWVALEPGVQRDAVAEACLLAGRSEPDRKRLSDLRMGYAAAGLAIELDKVLADPTCKPA